MTRIWLKMVRYLETYVTTARTTPNQRKTHA